MFRRQVAVFLLICCWLTITFPVLAGPASQRHPRGKRHQRPAAPRRHSIKQSGTRPVTPPTPVPQFENGETAREFEENAEARQHWFWFERTYPFQTLDVAARRRAWEQRPLDRFSTRANQGEWTAIGPSPTNSAFPGNWGVTSGRINTIAVSPANSQIILVGSATGGIWRSTNGGTSFSPVSDNQVDLAVGSITFAPGNSSTVYAGMGDTQGGYLGSGVLKSTDAGQTWTRISNATLPAPGRISKIEVDPANANRVYVAQYSSLNGSSQISSGFWLSTDGGVNWTRTWRGLARDLVINPANSQTLYLGMSRVDEPGSLPAGLYRSTDGGTTWAILYTVPHTSGTSDVRVAVTPADSQRIYVYTGGNIGSTFDVRVEVSTNAGAGWTNLGSATLDTGQFGYNTYIYADPTNADTVYVGTRDVFKSTNAGNTFTNLTKNFTLAGGYTPTSSNTHPDQHAFTFAPGNSSTLYVGNDGGISRSTNGGTNFTSLNSNLGLTLFVSYALHPTDAAISYGGTQDNGTQRRLAGGGWSEFSSGDGGRCVINPAQPSMIFTTYVYGTVYRWLNNGTTYNGQIASNSTFGEPSSGARIAFYPPLTGNFSTNTLYFGTWRLFASTDNGSTWAAPAGTFDQTKGGSDVLSALGVSKSNPQYIYSGSSQGRAMVSTNGGASWTDITTGLPNRTIKSITVDPLTPTTAWLTVSGYGSGHIFRTTNAGANWTDISGNLPNIPVSAFLPDPVTPSTLYAGTDIGVFRSLDSGTTWASFSNGMPPVVVTAFSAQANGLIHVGTYGRGAFETQAVVAPTITRFAPIASFPGKTITITGTNFVAGSTQVFFGGTNLVPAASVNVVNATTLTAVVPASGTGTANVNGYLTVRVNGTDATTQNLGDNSTLPCDPNAIFSQFVLLGDITGDGLSTQANDVALARAFTQFQATPSVRQRLAADVVPLNGICRGDGAINTTDITFLRAVSFGQTTF
ncbi:MAG: IPT/TIG domain-containing protein [Blastocatellia bacterium]|nr:IPT/TIG domain-containing protein [Blastocatellia bacterium]